jgi:hypothetical protein
VDGRSRGAVKRRRSVRSVVIIMMSEREVPVSVAQRITIKFLSQEGVKPAEILRRLTEQFKEQILSRARVFAWHKQFVEGREHVENEDHDRRPCTSVTENDIRFVQQLMRVTDVTRSLRLQVRSG